MEVALTLVTLHHVYSSYTSLSLLSPAPPPSAAPRQAFTCSSAAASSEGRGCEQTGHMRACPLALLKAAPSEEEGWQVRRELRRWLCRIWRLLTDSSVFANKNCITSKDFSAFSLHAHLLSLRDQVLVPCTAGSLSGVAGGSSLFAMGKGRYWSVEPAQLLLVMLLYLALPQRHLTYGATKMVTSHLCNYKKKTAQNQGHNGHYCVHLSSVPLGGLVGWEVFLAFYAQ